MRFWRLFLVLAVLVGIVLPASAQGGANPAGRWALRSGDATLLLLELQPPSSEAGRWTGRLMRPRKLQIDAGAFAALTVSDPAVVSHSVEGTLQGPHLGLDVEDGEGQVSRWRLTVADEHALLTLDEASPGSMLQPLRLVRAWADERVSGDLAVGSRFALGAQLPSNAEMKAIFEADQADRKAGPNIDWAAVHPRDKARRARTGELLSSGALQSGDDFWHAAFVFQHGGEASDYLLAHTLATIAAARGRPDATWIAAATLDRYLQAIGQKQIYGTQYRLRDGEGWTQEPYDRALISDALRDVLGVPGQAEQAQRVQEMEARRQGDGARR